MNKEEPKQEENPFELDLDHIKQIEPKGKEILNIS